MKLPEFKQDAYLWLDTLPADQRARLERTGTIYRRGLQGFLLACFLMVRIGGPWEGPLVMPDGTTLVPILLPTSVAIVCSLTFFVTGISLKFKVLGVKRVGSFFTFLGVEQLLMQTSSMSFWWPVLTGMAALELLSHILRAIVDGLA